MVNDKAYTGAAIYSIYNKLNGKLYIGKASYYNKRISEHLCYFRKGSHQNTYMQRAYNKNKDSFIYSIVEACPTEDLIEREIFWIKFLNTTDRSKGYNLTDGGEGCLGRVVTEETIEKIRNSNVKFFNSDKGILEKERRSKFLKDNPVMAGRKRTQKWKDKVSVTKKRLAKEKRLEKSFPIKIINNRTQKIEQICEGIEFIDVRFGIKPVIIYAKINKLKRKGIFEWDSIIFSRKGYTIQKV